MKICVYMRVCVHVLEEERERGVDLCDQVDLSATLTGY